jgi:hypothetical protein
MFGVQSLSTLRTTGNFTVKRTSRRETLRIHPYSSDFFVAEEVLPFVDIEAGNGHSARLDLDTGAPQTRVNQDTAKLMGVKLLTYSNAGKQRYQTFEGVLNLPGNSLPVTYKYFPRFTIPPSWVMGRYVPSVLLGWRAFDDFELNLDIEAGRSCFNKV